jgi:hypothetical protein
MLTSLTTECSRRVGYGLALKYGHRTELANIDKHTSLLGSSIYYIGKSKTADFFFNENTLAYKGEVKTTIVRKCRIGLRVKISDN